MSTDAVTPSSAPGWLLAHLLERTQPQQLDLLDTIPAAVLRTELAEAVRRLQWIADTLDSGTRLDHLPADPDYLITLALEG